MPLTVDSPWDLLDYSLCVLGLSSCVIICLYSVYIYTHQRRAKKHICHQELRNKVNFARQCVAAAKLSAVEIAVLAVEAGMKPYDVYRAYVNDEQHRKELVEAHLLAFARRMVEKHPSRFLSQGFAQQTEFLAALPPEERYRPVVRPSVRPVSDVKEVIQKSKSKTKSISAILFNK